MSTGTRAGLGCSITGNVMIDLRAKNEPGVVVIENETDLVGLSQWAAIGKRYNMPQIVQLSHPGKQCPKGLNKETVAPSAIGYGVENVSHVWHLRELTEAEIYDLIKRFGESHASVKRLVLKACRFMVHMAIWSVRSYRRSITNALINGAAVSKTVCVF